MVGYFITLQLTQLSIDHSTQENQIMRAGGVFWQSCEIASGSYTSAFVKPHWRDVCCDDKLRSLWNETGTVSSLALSCSEKKGKIN